MFKKNPYSTEQRPEIPFRRGLFKFIVLQYLKDKPSHGYEIITALTKRFHGLYVPSPGTVYPRLQMLADRGYVTFSEQDSRKVYSITEEGRRFLVDNAGLEKEINERLNDWENPENIEDIRFTMREYGRMGEMLTWEIRKMSVAKLQRVREILTGTAEKIDGVIKEKE
jgi:DNA-binding PadR family transcriptional regulator